MKVFNLISGLSVFVLIVLLGCRQIFGDREQPELIVQVPDESYEIIVTSPKHGSIWKPGDVLKINWICNFIEKIDIELYRKSYFQFAIAQNLENTATYEWKIPDDINLSNHYLVKIINHNNPDTHQFSGRFGIQ